jgi:aminoglycoside 6'-N-acetyltransferase
MAQNMALIHFEPLSESYFPLLLKWLKEPHVRAFWDKGINWDEARVREKYTSYVQGYKLVLGIAEPLFAFVIFLDEQPIGYIQFYDAHKFPREGYKLEDALPDYAHVKLAALDLFIGEKGVVGRGVGTSVLKLFLSKYVWPKFNACFVDPDSRNLAAIRAYEKAGFVRVAKLEIAVGSVELMVCT